MTNPKPVGRFDSDSRVVTWFHTFAAIQISAPPPQKIKSQLVNNQEILFIHKHLPLINCVCSLNFPGCPSADGQHKVFSGLSCLPVLLHSVYKYRSVFRNKSVWPAPERGYSPQHTLHIQGAPRCLADATTESVNENSNEAKCTYIHNLVLLYQAEMKMHQWKISNQGPAVAICVAATCSSI